MTPEAREAIQIADRHLAGESQERRLALATDIAVAICRHAQNIANDALKKSFAKARATRKSP